MTEKSGTIICYGASNTFGYDPCSYFGEPYEDNWVKLLEDNSDWNVENYGINGMMIPDTESAVNNALWLIEKISHKQPPVWFFIMLGGNDLLTYTGMRAEGVTKRMGKFLTSLKSSTEVDSGLVNLCLIAPVPMRTGAWVDEQRLITESERIGDLYAELAQRLNITFYDAGKWNIPTAYDGVHFTEEGHRIFADHCMDILKELRHYPDI